MDYGTFIGFFIGIFMIVVAVMYKGGDFSDFLSLSSAMIVLGGTFAATFINFPFRSVMGVFGTMRKAFVGGMMMYNDIIDKFVYLALSVREKSIMVLEDDLDTVEDDFFRKGLELAMNESNPERLRNYLKLELSNIERRHMMGQEVFFYMGAYAPAFGLVGTVMGLIMMLRGFTAAEGMGDMALGTFEMDLAQRFAQLLEGMAIALITTFYGILLSNLLFLPIAGKLKRKTDEEVMLREIMIEGIMCLQNKEHPIIVRDKLNAFIPAKQRVEALEERKRS